MLGSWSSAFLYAYIGIFLLSWVNLITSYKFLCPQFACWMLPPLDAKPISEVFSLKFTYSGEAHKHSITPTYISSSEPYDNLIIFFHIIEWILVISSTFHTLAGFIDSKTMLGLIPLALKSMWMGAGLFTFDGKNETLSFFALVTTYHFWKAECLMQIIPASSTLQPKPWCLAERNEGSSLT